MAEPFCKLVPESESEKAFVAAIKRSDPVQLADLLKNDEGLCQKIDTPWFAFDSPAVVAAKHNPEMVEILLKFGADINVRSDWWAGSFGVLDGVDAETANFLVSRGANWTIHSAAEQGRLDVVKSLIEADAGLLNARGGDGQTPLHVSTPGEVTQFLIEQGADLWVRDLDHSATAIQYSVQSPEKVRQLLAAGAEPDIFLACAIGDRELVEVILDSTPAAIRYRVGSCPQTKKLLPEASHHIYFWKLLSAVTALDVCRNFGQQQIYEAIFSRCSLNQQLIAAAWDEDVEVVKDIVAKHPELVANLELEDQQQLARAAWEGKLETVRLMLECGFDPHVAGDEESTPLDRAAFHGHREIVELLLNKDPQPPLNRENKYGGTPLSACVWGSVHGWKSDTDYIGTARLLIEAGSIVNESWLPIKNDDMNTLIRTHLNTS